MNYKEATLFSWAVMILIFALTYTTTTIIQKKSLPSSPLPATKCYRHFLWIYILFSHPTAILEILFTCKINDCIKKNSTFSPHISFVVNLRLERNISIIIFQITLSSSDSSFKRNINFSWVFDIFSHKSLSVCHLLLFFSFILVSLFMRSLSVTQST